MANLTRVWLSIHVACGGFVSHSVYGKSVARGVFPPFLFNGPQNLLPIEICLDIKYKKLAKHVTSGGVTFEVSTCKFLYFIYYPQCNWTSSTLRRCNFNIAIRHNRIFMLWHVVVANQLFLRITVAYYFLLRVVFGVIVFFFTCLLVSCGVCLTPVSPDLCYFWRFCWFRPPSHLRMGHFAVAHHTFLCALLLRVTEILLWVWYVVYIQTYIDIRHR